MDKNSIQTRTIVLRHFFNLILIMSMSLLLLSPFVYGYGGYSPNTALYDYGLSYNEGENNNFMVIDGQLVMDLNAFNGPAQHTKPRYRYIDYPGEYFTPFLTSSFPSYSGSNYGAQPLDPFVGIFPDLETFTNFQDQYHIYEGLTIPLNLTIPIDYPIKALSPSWPQPSPETPSFQPDFFKYHDPVPIRLSLRNPYALLLGGQITFTLKDLDGEIISREHTSLTLKPGDHTYSLFLEKVPLAITTEDFAHYILSYDFKGPWMSTTGEKSLFQVADKMEVMLIGPDSFYAGQPTAVGIHALVHGQSLPIEGANVTVELITEEYSHRLYEGTTDDKGFAEALVNIPEEVTGIKKIRARVSSGLGREEIEKDIEILRPYKILLTTDKPLYQPGHIIHIRTLTLQKPDLLPAAGKKIIIECEDSKGNKVFRVAPLSDEFGVVSTDFPLGSDINLGLYTIRALIMEDDIMTISEKKVTVDRYVLPKFQIDFSPDADYYSPGENVRGRIQAKYFFGKPVSNAQVTIEASKFDEDFVLFQTVTGTTDREGFFAFEINLPGYFVGLPLQQGDAFVQVEIKVEDSANHEEAITRELTVSKEPIHIQIIPESGTIVPGVENILYILTTDPKGRGLATHSLINFDGHIFTIDTDEQGLGTLALIPDAYSPLIFHVASKAGGKSALVEINLSENAREERILVRTDRAIYTVGQTMTMHIYTSEIKARRVFVDIIKDRQTILTKGIELKNGEAKLFLDLGADMIGTLLVEAYFISSSTETASDVFRDKKIVYVNPAEEIEVTATLDKDYYLPGEKAKIEFQVMPPQPVALGVNIVDEAVYALQENRPGLLKLYFNMEEEIMKPRFWPLIVPFEEAVTCKDLDKGEPEIAEVAFALAEEPPDPGLNESSYPDLIQRMQERLVGRIDRDAEEIFKALVDLRIYDNFTYQEAVREGKIKDYRDPWGNVYRVEQIQFFNYQFTLISNGPDEVARTIDDIVLTKPIRLGYPGGYSVWGNSSFGAHELGTAGGSITYVEPEDGFLAPLGYGGIKSQDTPEKLQEPRKIRRDFPETLLWEPSLITDSDGVAYLDVNMADSITTWRMSALASTLDGELGGETEKIVVFQDFFVDLDLPVTLTQNDEISLPVALYNYLNESQRVRIMLAIDENRPWCSLMDVREKDVDLEPGQVTVTYFRIKALRVGWHELTVFAYGTTMSDAIARTIEVVPDGREFHLTVSERLRENKTSHILSFPLKAIDEAHKIMVKVYPGIFSQVVEGLDKLFKVPFG
ncbi:MAG: alpha-2-macroglobulin family protein [bacterium]